MAFMEVQDDFYASVCMYHLSQAPAQVTESTKGGREIGDHIFVGGILRSKHVVILFSFL